MLFVCGATSAKNVIIFGVCLVYLSFFFFFFVFCSLVTEECFVIDFFFFSSWHRLNLALHLELSQTIVSSSTAVQHYHTEK